MPALVLQKVFFMLMTWHEGTTAIDVAQVIFHGLQLDLAVTSYLLTLPWLLLFVHVFLPNRFTKKLLWGYYCAVALVVSIIIVADTSLYPFWHFKLDASVFLYTDKPKDAMASVSTMFIIQRVLWVAVWTWLIIRPAMAINVFKDISFTARKPLVSCIFILLGGLIFLGIRGGVGKGTNNVSVAYYSENQYLNHASVNPVFNLIYSLGKQEDFGSEAQFFEQAECDVLLRGIYNTESIPTDTLLTTTRPNILLVIWEGACTYICDSLNAAPNLKALSAEGVSFTGCIANSFRTDRGQLSLLSGWPAIPKTSLMKLPEKCDHLSALPRTLLNAGYETKFWYGGDISFANTGGYMHQTGFRKTVSDKDFPASQKATDWGVYDGTLLDKLTDELLAEAPETRSFHTVMTLSSHEPWKVPVTNFDNERLNAFSYTDECIGRMISRLKKSPRWDNMLVIITSDHGVPLTDNQSLAEANVIRIPMLWIGGAVKQPKRITTLCNQADLPATLLGQMQIDHRDFIFSRDVLSATYAYPNAFHCYNGGITFVDSTGMTTYDLDGNMSITSPDKSRENKAKAILQNLYRKVADL